jgi:alpha-tubulin suppressor-like RCC1 family protein
VAGSFHSAAVLLNGSIVSWGDPHVVQSPAYDLTRLNGKYAVGGAAGTSFTLVLTTTGEVLVLGTLSIPAIASTNVVQVAAWDYTAYSLLRNGTVICYGYDNSQGQCTVPSAATANVKQVVAGGYYALALLSNGTVLGWGLNDKGQLTVPSSVQGKVASLAAGYSYAAALLTTGEVVVWGSITTTNSYALSGVTVIAGSPDVVLAIGNVKCPGKRWQAILLCTLKLNSVFTSLMMRRSS